MGLRERLAEQQRLLRGAEWPRWINHGVPILAVLLAAVAVGAHALGPLPHPGTEFTAGAAALIALSVVPWIVFWVAFLTGRSIDLPSHSLAFGLSVLAPLAALNVAGRTLGVAEVAQDDAMLSLMIVLFLVGQAVACAPWRSATVVTAAAAAIITGRAIAGDVGGTTPWLVGVLLAMIAGLALRANFVNIYRLQQAHHELARQAVAEERHRIASEVHDAVAHTLSVTMLHLTAARLAVDKAPAQAVEALEEAERQGRNGMSDIRRIVHLLRTDDQQPSPPPAASGLPAGSGDIEIGSGPVEPALPGIDELPELVASYRTAGLPVALDVGPLDGTISPVVGTALFRVAQESLANAAKHGTGPARVTLSVDRRGGATLTVRNPCGRPVDEASGTGLIGMTERVAGLGGTFRAGLVDDETGADSANTDCPRTWEVDAHLPAGCDQ